MIRSAVALLLVLAPLAAHAQETAPEVDESSGRQVRYKERTEIDFEGVELDGELVGPPISTLDERRALKFRSFIQLRTDFKPEMAQSVDNVK